VADHESHFKFLLLQSVLQSAESQMLAEHVLLQTTAHWMTRHAYIAIADTAQTN
jgi:hypothetical protein